jgi:GntR family transcriptional regulator
LAKRIDLEVEMGISNIRYIDANAEQSTDVQYFKSGSALLHVDRVIHAEDRPAAFLIDILPDDVVSPHELKKGFTGSVLDFLIKRGSPKLANSVADIQAVAATSEIARLLEIQRGDVLLCLTAKLFTENGRMIDYSTSFFLPGYFHFQVVRHVGGV